MAINEAELIKLIEESSEVSSVDLKQAQKTAKHLNCSVADVLLGKNLITDAFMGTLLSKHYGVDFVDLRKTIVTQETLNLIPESLSSSNGVIVFDKNEQTEVVSVAMTDPSDLELIELVKKTIGLNITILPFVATESGIKTALKRYKQSSTDEEGNYQLHDLVNEERSVVSIIEDLLEESVRLDVSDIHIEPLASQVLVRFRADGVLHDNIFLPSKMHSALIARIKILSDLKLDEHRNPQDGHFSYQTKRGDKVSLRVSTLPTVYGEKVVLRLLKDSLTSFNLEELGLLKQDHEAIEKVLHKSHGMFLVTGPTGSGKTTSLYTYLGLLNTPDVNIITVEDPVENRVRRINQIQVNSQIGLSFAQGLRSILRQDPDIIMVGEIRDSETAKISVNAAMTGHLVFSSVHANTASGVIPRLIDLGIEPFLLASTLNIIVAQRLVRLLCLHCIEKVPVSSLLKERLKAIQQSTKAKSSLVNYRSKGCIECNFSGYKGRTGLFELIVVDEEIRKLINSKASSADIWKVAARKNSKTMLEDGLIKVKNKLTSLEEVMRVISE